MKLHVVLTGFGIIFGHLFLGTVVAQEGSSFDVTDIETIDKYAANERILTTGDIAYVDKTRANPDNGVSLIEMFPGVPLDRIVADAALGDYTVYMLSDETPQRVVRYNTKTHVVMNGYPCKLDEEWLGLDFKAVDAMLYDRIRKILYFFSGTQLMAYRPETGEMNKGGAIEIAEVFSGVEAVKAAFFSEYDDGRYWLFDITGQAFLFVAETMTVGEGFPKPVEGLIFDGAIE